DGEGRAWGWCKRHRPVGAGRSSLFEQQQAYIVRQIDRGLIVADHQSGAAPAVYDIVAGAVIHRVVPRRSRRFLVEDLEDAGNLPRRCGVPGQAEEARIESGHVLREQTRRVALGIDGDEQALYALAVLAQRTHRGCEGRERGRANVGAAREPESDDDDLAREIGLGAQLAVGAEEPKVPVIALAGDVDALERERRSAYKHAARREQQ